MPLGTSVLHEDVDGIPLLSLVMMEACEEGRPEKLVRLLDAGMSPDTVFDADSGARLLHWAVTRDVVASRCLLEHGAAVNTAALQGDTPLMYAVALDEVSGALSASDSASIVRLLLAHGADPNMRNAAGHTAHDVLSGQTATEPDAVHCVLSALVRSA